MTGTEYKAYREKLGLTQAGLASLLGVSRKTVNARETGAVRITKEAELAIGALVSRDRFGRVATECEKLTAKAFGPNPYEELAEQLRGIEYQSVSSTAGDG
jgi:DNA-binding XRE family transcriptional regulator